MYLKVYHRGVRELPNSGKLFSNGILSIIRSFGEDTAQLIAHNPGCGLSPNTQSASNNTDLFYFYNMKNKPPF